MATADCLKLVKNQFPSLDEDISGYIESKIYYFIGEEPSQKRYFLKETF